MTTDKLAAFLKKPLSALISLALFAPAPVSAAAVARVSAAPSSLGSMSGASAGTSYSALSAPGLALNSGQALALPALSNELSGIGLSVSPFVDAANASQAVSAGAAEARASVTAQAAVAVHGVAAPASIQAPDLIQKAVPAAAARVLEAKNKTASASEPAAAPASQNPSVIGRLTDFVADKLSPKSGSGALSAHLNSLFHGDRASASDDASFDSGGAPVARKGDTVDDYHGTAIADPYRWLEDPNSEETKAFVKAQNEHSGKFLAPTARTEAFGARLLEMLKPDSRSMTWKHGKHYIFTMRKGLQNQSVIYKSKTPKGKPEVLLDPNTLSEKGTKALSGKSFDEKGKYMAYSISDSGSDWVEWRIREVETGQDLPEILKWSKFSGASWEKDGSGFYYRRYPQPKEGDELTDKNAAGKIYFHRVGTPQEQDELIFEDAEHPERFYSASADGKFLFLTRRDGSSSAVNYLYVKDRRKKNAEFKPFLAAGDASYDIVHRVGDDFWILTNKNAPRKRLIKVNLRRPEPENWVEVIPETDDRSVLRGVSLVNNQFVTTYEKDAHEIVKVFNRDGSFDHELQLPGIGATSGLLGSARSSKARYTYTSFNEPGGQYEYDMKTRASKLLWRPEIPVNPDDFTVSQVFYPSKDGTKVPMFIVHKKGLKLDGNNPTLLYAYGGFGNSMTPYFSSSRVAWMEQGGVFALANIRGGSEYGQEWHDGGRLHNKQNTFDDFIAAGEYLISAGYTSNKKLAITGGSNGGLTVAASMLQRPDLFAAAVPDVGVLDMLRYHLFTIGWAWATDYLTSATKAGFDTLIKYSPLHNVKPGGNYPATMVTTGDHDDRVVPAHSYKFAAALQAAQAGLAPILLRVATDAGHGAGKPLQKVIEEITEMYGFLFKVLGVDDKGSV